MKKVTERYSFVMRAAFLFLPPYTVPFNRLCVNLHFRFGSASFNGVVHYRGLPL